MVKEGYCKVVCCFNHVVFFYAVLFIKTARHQTNSLRVIVWVGSFSSKMIHSFELKCWKSHLNLLDLLKKLESDDFDVINEAVTPNTLGRCKTNVLFTAFKVCNNLIFWSDQCDFYSKSVRKADLKSAFSNRHFLGRICYTEINANPN